jgi:predicted dehydrogenase
MRFAVLGDHPAGLGMAQALAATGRHDFHLFLGTTKAHDVVRAAGLSPRRSADVEDVLADPAVELLVVAGRTGDRPAQLRRALQSERHVLCVHPADHTPDVGYEAALIQADTRHVLLPLLTEGLHPAVARLRELLGSGGPLGEFRLVEMERWSRGTVLMADAPDGHKPAFPGWDLLRALWGEIAEVVGFAAGEAVLADDPVLVAGRFERGGLFRATLLPHQSEERWRLSAVGAGGQAELTFAAGFPGPARLHWSAGNAEREESWPAWEPWPTLVTTFEDAVAASAAGSPGPPPTGPEAGRGAVRGHVTWQDEVRGLELDDAARRSIARRRASTLEYQEVSEEVGFKGTMTLVGCGMLWVMILLVILSHWFPALGWAIIPLLAIFLGLQLLRWIIPKEPAA